MAKLKETQDHGAGAVTAPKLAAHTPTPTRYKELGFRQDAPGVWRFVDLDGFRSVGPFYKTKAELLADLERYASVFGASQ